MSDPSDTPEPNPPEGRTETVRGNAGEARRLSMDSTGALEDTPGRLTAEEVAERQERISHRRKPAGPEHGDAEGFSIFSEEAPSIPDVPPTEAADPPVD